MINKVCFDHRVAWLGGNSGCGAVDGGFARNFNNDATNSNWNRRCRGSMVKNILLCTGV